MAIFSQMSNPIELLLTDASWRLLRGIAYHAEFPFHHNQPREEVAKALAQHLRQPTVLKGVVAGLPEYAKDLLIAIWAGTGEIERKLLVLIGGDIRSLTYQNLEDAPWREPQTDSEQLVYRGLLYRRQDGERDVYCCADEIIAILQEELLPPPALPSVEVEGDFESLSGVEPKVTPLTTVEMLRHDMLQLLLFLQHESPKVLTKHRLPITVVRRLQFLLVVRDFDVNVRSHTQASRLWFLSSLARQAGLVYAPLGARWMPTPMATTWVAASESEQLAQLWQAWPIEPPVWPPTKWPREWHEVYKLVAGWQEKLLRKLGALDAGLWVKREAWQAAKPALLELTEWGRYEPPAPEEQAQALTFFLDEFFKPLAALGVLQLSEDEEALRLTKLGAIWLTIAHKKLTPEHIQATAEKIAPLLPTREAMAWERQDYRLKIPWPVSFDILWQLVPFVTVQSGGLMIECDLTPATINYGLSRGFPLADLRHALASGGLVLPADLLPTYPAPHLHQGYWLEVNDPRQLSQLREDKGIRLALRSGKSLSSRHHTVDPRYLNSLQKALKRLGQPAVITQPKSQPEDEFLDYFNDTKNDRKLPYSGHLLLAARLWQRQVIQHDKKYPSVTKKRPYIPRALIDALASSLTPLEHATVEQLWQEALAQLEPSSTERPPVEGEVDEGLRHLTPLQQAIDRGLDVRLIYQAAGKDVSERIVDPHYLQKRRHIWYLHAYCRQAQDNRTFRLDRIRTLTVLELKKWWRR